MEKLIILLLVIFSLSSTACKNDNEKLAQDSPILKGETLKTLKAASENYLKAWSANDTSMLRQISIRNVVRNVNGEINSSDQNGLISLMNHWHTALPDFKVVPNEIVIQGNRSYINWTCTGTNTGMLGEMTPTGKKSESDGFSVLTFDDNGQLIHENAFYSGPQQLFLLKKSNQIYFGFMKMW